jgi:hypothetical protein
MCYDAKTSIGTFLFVSAAAVYLWMRNGTTDRAIGLILVSISFIQLAEFIIWTHLGPTPQNHLVSTLIPLLLYLQPVLISFIMWVFKAGLYPEFYKFVFYGSVAFSPIFLYYLSQMYKPATYSVIGPKGHLIWPSNNFKSTLFGNISLAVYVFIILFMFATLKNRTLAMVFLLGYGISGLYYKLYYDRDWGSVWCHSSNAMTVAALLF